MPIAIYTYSNPYDINTQSIWETIKNAPHFCVSQTMVNGLLSVYPELRKGQVGTVEQIVNALYGSWNDNTQRYIEQYAVIDRLIEETSIDEKKKQSMKFNKKDILDSIRLLIELDIDINDLDIGRLSKEQKYVINLYKQIVQSEDSKLFFIRTKVSKFEVEEAINKALKNAHHNREVNAVPNDLVVFHGIHQFAPLITRTIEVISQYKQVVLLFNYQKQYKNIYQTWMDIYSIWDIPINSQLSNEFRPTSLLSLSYEGNTLADQIGQLAEGKYSGRSEVLNNLEIIEFDNITEFASYVGRVYQNALDKYNVEEEPDAVFKRSPLYYMQEQFYAADATVNDILKVYYPDQFGERHFLAYPIGHFFIALADMWDIEQEKLIIESMDKLIECLNSGIIYEKQPGELVGIFNIVKYYFEREDTIDDIVQQLKKLLSRITRTSRRGRLRRTENNEDLLRLNYFNVTSEQVEQLINALKEIDAIAHLFYEECEESVNDFNKFYIRIKEFVENKVLGNEILEEEFEDVIKRLIGRLSSMQDMTTSGTFNCLKETMSYYLKQEESEMGRAKWIVRDFEQIDGDVLKSSEQDEETYYHFCALSDANMNVSEDVKLPWPLNMKFFEYAYEAKGHREQLYIKSMKEYKNFKRYALVYGLLFNRVKCKLSYIKNEEKQENDYYYFFKLLGLRKTIYLPDEFNEEEELINIPEIEGEVDEEYSLMDYYKWNLCKYKFALETLIEGGTKYKEKFLMLKYLEILLENKVRVELENKIFMESEVKKALEEGYQELADKFQLTIDIDEVDIITNAYQYLVSLIVKNNRFPIIEDNDRKHMEKKKEFIYLSLSRKENPDENILVSKLYYGSDKKVKETLVTKNLEQTEYIAEVDEWCKVCPNKEVCLESYKLIED